MAKRKSKKRASSKHTTSTTPVASTSGRSRTRERRAERQKQKQQQRQLMIVGGVAAIAVLIAIAFILSQQPASAPIPEGTLDLYDGIPQGKTDEGFSVLGNLDAPVRIEDFSDFSCPTCAGFHESWNELIVNKVRDGIASLTYIPLTNFGSVPNSRGAARAAICAGDQGTFFEYHDALFDWQRNYGNQAFTQNRLSSGVKNLGLNEGQHNSCLDSSRTNDTLDTAARLAADRGVQGTPTIYINGVQWDGTTNVGDAIDNALRATGLGPVPLTDDMPTATQEAEATEEAAESESEETAEATEEAGS